MLIFLLITTVPSSQDKVIVPVKKEKKEELEQGGSEEQSGKDQDEEEAMDTEREVDDRQQQQPPRPPIGPARPVQPTLVNRASPPEVPVRNSVVIFKEPSLFHQFLKHACEDYGQQECLHDHAYLAFTDQTISKKELL